MAKPIDKNAVAKKMFDEGEPDDLLIEPERSSKRVTIREEAGVSLIKRRSPAQFIPLASIVKRSVSQVRMSDFNPEKYPEDKCLLESIRNRGVVTPVMVKEFIEDDDDLLADTRYELIYGHRRVSACKVLGFTTIPAFVVESTVSSADVTMTENIGVRTLNAYERGREFDSYLSSHSISLRAFSEQNGFPHPYVIELIRAYKSSRSCPEIEALYQDGRLYSRDIPDLTALYEKSDEPVRELLVEMLPDLSRKQMKELTELCSTGGSAAGYLKALKVTHGSGVSPEPAADTKTEPENPHHEENVQIPELTDLWKTLENDGNYVRRQAALFDCSETDVKEAARICRKGNARPELLRCMLLIRKNGGEITEKALETVQRISEDRNAERAVSLYLSAYEKLEKQRKACEKRFGALHPDGGSDMEILNRLLGR